jgi:hypothetical protein
MRRAILALCAALTLGLAAPARAQLSSGHEAPTRPAAEIAGFAGKVEAALAARGARVAIVGRIGRDPAELPPGLTYTHVGFWVYSEIRTADGRIVPGYAVYNLYQKDEDPDSSELKQDFPPDFFASVYQLRSKVIIPSPELQARLLRIIASPTYAKLHNPRYSVVANPYRGKYQNCTDFVLEIIMAALYRTEDEQAIRSDIQAYFEATPVKVGGAKRLLGSLFVRGVAVSDQDDEIRTATIESIAAFLQRYSLASEVFEVAAP